MFTCSPAHGFAVGVLSISDSFKVPRPDAPLVLAEMVDVKPIFDGADIQCICESVGKNWSAAWPRKFAVTVTTNTALPHPAGVSFHDASNEAHFEAAMDFDRYRDVSLNVPVSLPAHVMSITPSTRPGAVCAVANKTWVKILDPHEVIIRLERSGK